VQTSSQQDPLLLLRSEPRELLVVMLVRRWTTAVALQAPIPMQMITISTATRSQAHPTRWNLSRATALVRAARPTVQYPRAFDVGRDESVIGELKDPVGLVGCVVVVPWPVKGYRCVVDACACDAPDGPSYVISWLSNRDEHHLLSCARMATFGAQCSATVKSKLQGTHQRRSLLMGRSASRWARAALT
jgi:hypothetical protein